MWHQRLGHTSKKGIKVLVTNQKILETVKIGFCVFKKKKKVPFSKTEMMPKVEKSKLFHTNVYGSTLVTSLGGS